MRFLRWPHVLKAAGLLGLGLALAVMWLAAAPPRRLRRSPADGEDGGVGDPPGPPAQRSVERPKHPHGAGPPARASEPPPPPPFPPSAPEAAGPHAARRPPSSFAEAFAKLPWEAIVAAEGEAQARYEQLLVDFLARQLTVPPPAPANSTCGPPPPPGEVNCSGHPTALTGARRDAPATVGHAVQLGFDADVLEVHLNEVYDLVDYFFILESTLTHKDMVRKPLMWEALRRQRRFRRFLPKVVHLVVDDQEALEAVAPGAGNKTDLFALELLQDRRRYEKIVHWNAATGAFRPGDVLGFGDADEVPSREVLRLLRSCHTKAHAVDVGIWFPFGRVDKAFSTDWPVPGHRYTLGDPTFYTLTAEDLEPARCGGGGGVALSRGRGTSGNYLLGGMHMSYYGYFPYAVIKRVTASEGGLSSFRYPGFLERVRSGSFAELADEMAEPPDNLRHRIVPIDRVPESDRPAIVMPWFLRCNPDRYPRWFGKPDPRENTWFSAN